MFDFRILELENERKDQLNQSLDDLTDREEVAQCLNDLISNIIHNEEFVQTTSIHIPIIIIEDPVLEVINTNEETSETSENDLTESINRLETSLEKSDIFEQHCTIVSTEEPINETDENQINTLDNTIKMDPREESFLNSLPITSTIVDTSIVELPPVPIKKEKRFSLVHSYSLPPDTIVSHMACSNTYIYVCTNQKVLYYSKAPENNVYYSLHWYPYKLPAERVIVSHTNQTIWRIIDHHIYAATDTVRVSALGINWTELTFHNGENLPSISINDQYGW